MALTDLHLKEITRKEKSKEVGLPRLQIAYESYVRQYDGISGDAIRNAGASLPRSKTLVLSFEGLRLLETGHKDYWSLLYEVNPWPERGLCLGQRAVVMFPQDMQGSILVYSNAKPRSSLPVERVKALVDSLAEKFEQVN